MERKCICGVVMIMLLKRCLSLCSSDARFHMLKPFVICVSFS